MSERIIEILVKILFYIFGCACAVIIGIGLAKFITFGYNQHVSQSQVNSNIEQLSGKIYVYTDPETNLQYLVYTVNGGICPRYGADGRQMNGG